MPAQPDLFSAAPQSLAAYPPGLRYVPDVLSAHDEAQLLAHVRELPFRAFEFHGYTGKRRVVSFGWRYDFASEQLAAAAPIPDFLLALRPVAATVVGVAPDALEQVLVSEYAPGAGIGWHRDKRVFGQVAGISLLAPCVFRLRRRLGAHWARATFLAEPRSAYALDGDARLLWEHSIPPVAALRYSITFRSLRRPHASADS